MTKHLEHDLERLRKEILAMGAMVEDAIDKAIRSLTRRDPELARAVLAGDDAIDRKELEVEEACLAMLALHQPVAGDLRFIVAMLKVNNDLERMGDLAQNIGERSLDLSASEPLRVELDLTRMVDTVRRMVSQSLDALVRQDPLLARSVCAQDDVVDECRRQSFAILTGVMTRDVSAIERAIQWLSVTRHLERIADSATNIAEDVVFMVEGEIIRHSPRSADASPR